MQMQCKSSYGEYTDHMNQGGLFSDDIEPISGHM
jgi:hypothetical protein